MFYMAFVCLPLCLSVCLCVCLFFFYLLATSCRDYQLDLHLMFTSDVSMNEEKLIKLNCGSHPHLDPGF